MGKFDLESPDQLIRLLARMTRNRLINHVEELQAAKRDIRRVEKAAVEDMQIRSPDAPVSQVMMAKELSEIIRGRLAPDERRVCDARRAGQSWEEIAAREGKKPDAVRKQHARVLERIAPELGLSVIDFQE
jgi:RNA polymerase sigma factor (sigma-70 family)